MTEYDWGSYYDKVSGRDPRDTVVAVVEAAGPGDGRLAADLGCGDGVEAIFLAEAGWRVLAVDAETVAADRVLRRVPARLAGSVDTLVSRFEDLTLPPLDLVHASYSLPFCHPDSFDAMWDTVATALRPGAWFSGVLFGVNDSWASEVDDMTFLTRPRTETLFEGFDVLSFVEEDADGQSADGPKHWHTFTVLAHRPN